MADEQALHSVCMECIQRFKSSPQPLRAPHLIKDLQVERVDPWGHCALDDFVPPRVLGSVVCGWGLIYSVAQSDSAVWIHPGHTIVFSQFGLYSKINKVQL